MRNLIVRTSLSLTLAAAMGATAFAQEGRATELLNVSYDATRELWQELNQRFIAHHQKHAGVKLAIRQSHGGSTRQADAVSNGEAADVVTLALWSDTDALRKKGLIAEGWERRLPNRSLPYTSTIVFVVRQGNPKKVRDWADLIKPGVRVVTPDPRTSGNGQLSFLAAWGSVLRRGGSESEAQAFVERLYQQAAALDADARQATVSFAQKALGDVHLTWENEAHKEVRESGGKLEIVYPSVSIRAEPHVAVVDANVDRKKTRAAAEAYLKFLYTDEAQEVIARHFYRPIRLAVLRRHARDFPEIELFTIQELARDWDSARQHFFTRGGVFDRIASSQPK
jgi:sulfate transport system substrate-binding protein